jgi:hypothetical protein
MKNKEFKDLFFKVAGPRHATFFTPAGKIRHNGLDFNAVYSHLWHTGK